MEKKLMLLVSIITLVLISGKTYAQGINLAVTAQCPPSVSKGDSITIGLQITNYSAVYVDINKSAIVALFPDGEVFGPVTVPISKTIGPGRTVNIANYVTYQVPPTILANTLVGHGIVLCGNNFGEDCYEGDGCLVEILP